MKLLWLQSGGCGGCTLSLLCHDSPDLFGQLADAGIEIVWHPSLSEASADEVLELLGAYERGEQALDLLCVEGSMLRGPHGSGGYHRMAGSGRPLTDIVRNLAQRAKYVVAVGSCAAYGGITAAGSNLTDACGLQYDERQRGGLLDAGFISRGGMPVINIAGCPTHPGWVVDTLMSLAMGQLGPQDLDGVGRPRLYADRLVHHGCTRNEFYEFKASAVQPSHQGCLMEHMGCKGTRAHADCNTRLWNGQGSCLRGGFPCIACTEPGFEEPGHPLSQTPKIAGIPIGLPADMPKAWFVALGALSKSATPRRVRENAVSFRVEVPPEDHKSGLK
ncbi:HupU protein [Sinimarinibacterium sp. CAU 1509]|uniref:NADH-quinone oxidoreductase subunit B family protein n=1 Tax=Sinimarinibacterium sp. CAU 1509 TaxID=2562283 RepID=UPI0010AB80CB|nr:HupU protein [Sinimarinibacterium sp. CAU 1509]TJY60032.1 HupU protein [Sinimarinibacterium sp. CAU 1509]